MMESRCPLISILVPVYNVELYLEECLESIRQQTYKNFEVILVDDGSNDESPVICDRYAVKDSRFRVIHQRNAGLENTRNVGIREHKGSYVTFVDSDDKLGQFYLEKLLAPFIADSSIDVTLGRIVYVDFLGVHRLKSKPIKPQSITKVEAFRSLVNPKYGRWSMVAKLFRSSCVKNIAVNENLTIGEDFDGTWKIFHNINKAYYADVEDYYYLWHPSSMTNRLSLVESSKHYRNYVAFMHDEIVTKNSDLNLDMNMRFVTDFYDTFKRYFYEGDCELEAFFYEFKDVLLKAVKSIQYTYLSNEIEKQFQGSFGDFLSYQEYICEKLKKSSNLYIYGGGRKAKQVVNYFKRQDIKFNKYIVSDNQEYNKSPDGEHEVIRISDLTDKSNSIIFIAMILRNALEIMPKLNFVPRENVYF